MKIMILAAMAAVLSVPAAASETAWADALAGGVAKPAAQTELEGTVVRDQTTEVNVDLNSKSVKCSAAGYSMPLLKVLVPGLADLTILNHRNRGEAAPCIASERCDGDFGPDNILKAGEGVEQIPVRVVLKRVTTLDGEVCHVTLVETVQTTIRGIQFNHERRQGVADRAAGDCR